MDSIGLSLQEGGGPLGGDFTYLRVLPDLRGYVSVGEENRLTFATRLRIGELFPIGGQSAVVTRFFGGGGISMRGFNDRRLSPLLEAPAPPSPGSTPVTLTLPIGGDGLIEGSFETRLQVTQSLVLAAFVDYGQVTEGRIGPDDVSTLLWAVGFGLRYRTPIGPIRVDFARRLQARTSAPLAGDRSDHGSRVPQGIPRRRQLLRPRRLGSDHGGQGQPVCLSHRHRGGVLVCGAGCGWRARSWG
jgi:translocation and assembly module TamA